MIVPPKITNEIPDKKLLGTTIPLPIIKELLENRNPSLLTTGKLTNQIAVEILRKLL